MKRRRHIPKRKPEALLRRAREAQAPAGWVPLDELALRLDVIVDPSSTYAAAAASAAPPVFEDVAWQPTGYAEDMTDARGGEKRKPEEAPDDACPVSPANEAGRS